MSRLDNLKAALQALPPPDDDWVKRHPTFKKTGFREYTYLGVDYDPRISNLFKRFRDGDFGIAERDRDYVSAICQWDDQLTEPWTPKLVAGLDREHCLLLLRYYDRQERFGEGLRAAVHKEGLLHAILERLIALETAGS